MSYLKHAQSQKTDISRVIFLSLFWQGKTNVSARLASSKLINFENAQVRPCLQASLADIYSQDKAFQKETYYNNIFAMNEIARTKWYSSLLRIL